MARYNNAGVFIRCYMRLCDFLFANLICLHTYKIWKENKPIEDVTISENQILAKFDFNIGTNSKEC